MPLKLTITSYQRLSPGQETSKILNRGSISIGRAAQNDWVLQDPERILSKQHCTVLYRDGAYFLTDLSVNGTFLNDSEQRIARDQTVELKDGDHFILGEYEIAVTLQPEAADLIEAVLEEPLTDIVASPGTDLFGAGQPSLADLRKNAALDVSLDIAKSSFDDILAGDRGEAGLQRRIGAVPGAVATAPSPDLSSPERISFELPSLIPGATPVKPGPPPTSPAVAEPLAETPDPFAPTRPEPERPAQPPPAITPSIIPDAVERPPVGGAESVPESLIPDDWWMHPPTPPGASRPAIQTPAKSPQPATPPRQAVPQPMPQPPPTPLEQRRPETPSPAPQPTPAAVVERAAPGADALLRAFFQGAGLPQLKLAEEQLPEVMANLGAILRETVQGLIEILLARGDVKGEFRLDRTAMGPIENNPLKTPPGRPPLSPEEVMTLLLIRQKEAYMSPVQAVREGFNDIKAHQLAVVAGIQAALNRLLERFDPSNLEARLEQSVLDNLWPANRKAKYWDLFTSEYQAIAREAEDDFNELFGDEFARAYEGRLRGH